MNRRENKNTHKTVTLIRFSRVHVNLYLLLQTKNIASKRETMKRTKPKNRTILAMFIWRVVFIFHVYTKVACSDQHNFMNSSLSLCLFHSRLNSPWQMLKFHICETNSNERKARRT